MNESNNNSSNISSYFINCLLLAALVALVIIFLRQYFLWGYCRSISNLDGKEHPVQCEYADREKAADLLADLNVTAYQLIEHLNRKYGDKNNDRGKITRNLTKRYRGVDRLVETDPNNSLNDTAYTLDKGYLVSMCLRKSKDKNLSDFHSKNLLTFVFIHELTHIGANVQQHPQRFWDAFKWMLQEAVEAGLYSPVDYATDPIQYCAEALKVSYSPLYDDSLNKICCN